MLYNIAMVTDGLEFTGDSLDTQAMGGSETAFICVAREFARAGHHVRVYCKCSQEGDYDGVRYMDNTRIRELAELGECDILIVSRFVNFFGIKYNSKLNILWNHDILVDTNAVMSMTWNIDYMYCLTEYHRQQYVKKLPDIQPIIKIIPNGIDEDLLIPQRRPDEHKRQKLHRIMFTSRPERGLYKALELYEKLGDKDLEFISCNYATLKDPRVQDIEDLCYQKMQRLGRLGFNVKQARYTKADLYHEIAQAKAVIYPTDFPEIFCISAIEAQANGTAFITTEDFAMKETVGYSGIEPGPDYDAKFLGRMREVIYSDAIRATLEAKGREHVQDYTWWEVANQFIQDATQYFEHRAIDQKGVVQRLIYNSDMVMARAGCVGVSADIYAQLDRDLRYVDGRAPMTELYDDESTHEVIDMDVQQAETNTRFQWLAKQVQDYKATRVLDYGCHMGASTILTSNRCPGVEVTGFDISGTALAKAELRRQAKAKYPDKVIFTHRPESIRGEQFDLLFCGEMLEHVLEPEKMIDELEQYVRPGGIMTLTVPRGAWEYLKHVENHEKGKIYHVHNFEYWDLIDMLGAKTKFKVETVKCFNGAYDEAMGNYLITYTVDGAPTGKRDLARKLLTTRPHQTISACIIAKDAAKEIETMIESIHTEMDEILVGIDPATTDETRERLAKYYKVKVLEMPHAIQGPDFWGFANARNWVTDQATGKWIFWIDTDEKIIQTELMRKYLEGTILNAFVIRQHHAQFDNFIVADNPHRLYRAGTGAFAGYIHEQPQDLDDINSPIEPALILNGVDIVNFGEVTEGVRRNKAVGRNLQLLKKDMQENVDKRREAGLPIRKLSIILLMRDFYNRIRWNIERYGTADTKDCRELCLPKIKELFEKYFSDETDPIYRDMAEGILQNTYNEMKLGVPCEFTIDGKSYKRRIMNDDIDRVLEEIDTTLQKKTESVAVI